MALTIEEMDEADWPAVAAIYGEGIATGNATFEQQVPTWESWDASHHAFCRLVAWVDGELVGWAALSPVSRRQVYTGVAEHSVYVAGRAQGQGVGRALLQQLIEVSEAAGIWMLQSSIFPENLASLTLHERCGFREVGRRERVAQMHGIWRDTVFMERRSRVVGV